MIDPKPTRPSELVHNTSARLSELAHDELGATLMSYVIIVGLIGLLAFAGFRTFGQSLFQRSGEQSETVTCIPGSEGSGDGCSGQSGSPTSGTSSPVPTGPIAQASPEDSSGQNCPGGVCTSEGNCFVAGTHVWTPEGERPIEEIRVGDEVESMDPASGQRSRRAVLRTFARRASSLVDVQVESAAGIQDVVRSTPEHPFWTLDRGWTLAGELAAGESILDQEGGEARVVSVTTIPIEAPVYNFEVDTDHAYFVGDLGLLVHNTCPNHPGAPTVGGRFCAVPGCPYGPQFNQNPSSQPPFVHYTNGQSVQPIVNSGYLNPSQAGPHAVYGQAVYGTYMQPSTLATPQGFDDANQQFYNGKAPQKLTGFVQFTAPPHQVVPNNPQRPDSYRIPTTDPLPIGDSTQSYGVWQDGYRRSDGRWQPGQWQTTSLGTPTPYSSPYPQSQALPPATTPYPSTSSQYLQPSSSQRRSGSTRKNRR